MQETLQNHSALLSDLPETLGATLTRTRLAKKFDLREAASRIGVDASVIQALEEDNYQHLGAPVFARSFLLRYSRLLELSEQDVLERYRQMGLDEPPPLKVERPIQRQARMTDMRWLAYPVVVVGVLWLSYVGFERLNVHYSPDAAQTSVTPSPGDDTRSATVAPPQNSPDPQIAAEPIAEEIPTSANPMAPALAASNDPIALLGGNAPAAADNSNQVPVPQNQTVEVVAPPGIAAPTEPSVDPLADVETVPDNESLENFDPLVLDPLDDNTPMVAIASVLPDGQAQLELTFSDDCWVEVRDANDERLVRAILNANTVNRFVGQAPFSVTLGNVAGVTGITLNGEAVDASVYTPSRGNVGRFTLEAPQG